MANENETVANVHDDMLQVVADEFGNVTMAQSDFVEYAVRFVAAHTRDLADFQRRYDECVRKFNEVDLERVRLRDEIAAKDAEITSLKIVLGNLLNRVSPKCAGCDDVCDTCGNKNADLIPIAKNALVGDVINADDYALTPLGKFAKNRDEIASLRALVKEMSDLLTKVNDVEYVDVTAWFDGSVDAEQQEWLDSAIDAIHKCQLAFDGIIAKAREVCK